MAARSGQSSAQKYVLAITPVTARYVRVTNVLSKYTANANWHYVYATELQVYSTATWGGAVTPIRHYYLGGQRVATRDADGLKYLHADHLGSTGRLSNASGVQVREVRYDPWGKVAADTSGAALAYKFTDQEQDGTGLYDYGARAYDPLLGRFISADTIVPNPANPQSLNRYSYVLGNPLKFVDPTGHFTEDAITAYLKNQYGNGWESYLNAWQADGDWWKMITTAQAGDVLTMMAESGFENYQFLGQGIDVLRGVVWSADIAGSQTHPNINSPLELLRGASYDRRDLYRVGLFRMVSGHATSQYVFHGARVDVSTHGLWEATMAQLPWALAIGAIALPLSSTVIAWLLGGPAATLGPQAAVEWIGGKEGDDMIFIALIVPGGYYDTRIVVRGGQELIGGRTYITPDMLPSVDCGGSCP